MSHLLERCTRHVTVIGKITPQKEFELFPQKNYDKDLFKIQAKASYGIPVVGNIFIFAALGMSAFAVVGPGKFYNIVIDGTYSTDPQVSKSFSIQGSINISAAAGLKLRAEAGVGLEILAHDIKAGAGVDGIAGIKGYAEATPKIGYRENAEKGEDKKGEFFIRGDVEIAAQPFLGLSGDVFVEIDAPWWSPVPDKKWVWPLGAKEWPIGGSFGFAASVDYVFGSKGWPTIEFKPAEFQADKFMSDLYADKAKDKSGEPGEVKGAWHEKNTEAAEPPKPGEGKGAPPSGRMPPAKDGGKAPPPPAAKTIGKPADPNAKTADGRTVKGLQDKAAAQGKKPPAPAAAGKGAEPQGPTKAGTGAEEHDKKLAEGLRALDAVTARYARDGATKDELETGVKSVRRKFTVFKSIEVVDGGDTWDYKYVATTGTAKGAKKLKEEIGILRKEIRTRLLDPLFRPGPNAVASVKTMAPGVQDAPEPEREEVDKIGRKYFDHHNKSIRYPGAERWIPDHQPVIGLVLSAKTSKELRGFLKEANLPTTFEGQRLYPHSLQNARQQGGETNAVTSKVEKLERLKQQK